MIINLVISLGVLALAALLGWLAVRLWRAHNPFVKWPAGIATSLLTLIVAAVGVLALAGLAKFYAPGVAPAPDVKVDGTPQQVERGQYLANGLCVECHSPSKQLPLSGGVDFAKEIPFPIGTIVSANLTPGGPLKDWTDGDIWRTLRSGVDRDGHHLIVMSGIPVRNLSDEDIRALIAFLRSQPADTKQTPNPPDQPSFVAAVMFGAGMFPGGLPPVADSITAPARGPTAEYGRYLVSFIGCRDCHGQDLTGGKPGGLAPVGPSLRVVQGWTAEQFVTTLHTGVDPTGHALPPEKMPWQVLGRMQDDDLHAIYLYLASLQ